jgi:hypothetical protein
MLLGFKVFRLFEQDFVQLKEMFLESKSNLIRGCVTPIGDWVSSLKKIS